MQQVRFRHPLREEYMEMELPLSTSFKAMQQLLQERGFITPKRGGYHFIIEDRLCGLSATLADYLPYPAPQRVEIIVHGLLVVLT